MLPNPIDDFPNYPNTMNNPQNLLQADLQPEQSADFWFDDSQGDCFA